MSHTILGISARFHDSAACVLVDGHIVAAAQEERFSRKKHDASLPANAIRYCLAEAGIKDQVDAVAFYDKPIEKFYRILESFLCTAPKGLRSFNKAMPIWMQDKLWLPPQIEQCLSGAGIKNIGNMYFAQHHESHAASAFYPSPFEDAAILTIDGVGEWATVTIGVGEQSSMELLKEIHFPDSLGMLYSAFTYFCGFKANSDEYKLMGLAPYGECKYSELIKKELMDIKEDGSFRLNMKYFGFLDEEVMINERFCHLFDGPARLPGAPITQREMDLARSVQAVTEEIILLMARHARDLTGKKNLCMAGGVALNCVANGRLAREKIFEQLWIQPAADDAGASLGAALTVHHNEFKKPRPPKIQCKDDMQGSLLGPAFSDQQIQEYLDAQGIIYQKMTPDNRAKKIAGLVAEGNIVGLFDGRMEFGPRALGNRSIIADPRSPTMQSTLNQKIKFRESFRPFAAAVLEEKMAEYFEIDFPSSYMLFTAKLREHLRNIPEAVSNVQNLADRLGQIHSTLPAITHVDYSCRLQSVSQKEQPRFYDIITAFETLTGIAAVINTSFNVRDEPIVCTPTDAWRCFMKTHMDVLVMGSFLILRKDQPDLLTGAGWEHFFSGE